MYGQISAANSLSDVYAMGGQPLTAMNVVAYSPGIFPPDVLLQILQGGYDKVLEAGAITVGGHTATDDELKYGLSVTGICHPDNVITNAGAKPGDRLVLTKPIGTGIITTALKAGKDLGQLTSRIIDVMATLNKAAGEAMQETGVHACTDITGFGLLGHTFEVAAASKAGIRMYASEVPVFAEAFSLIKDGYVPGGTNANQMFLEDKVRFDPSVAKEMQLLMCDAQTSGGLLIAVAADRCDHLLAALSERKVSTLAVIGEVVSAHPGFIEVLA